MQSVTNTLWTAVFSMKGFLLPLFCFFFFFPFLPQSTFERAYMRTFLHEHKFVLPPQSALNPTLGCRYVRTTLGLWSSVSSVLTQLPPPRENLSFGLRITSLVSSSSRRCLSRPICSPEYCLAAALVAEAEAVAVAEAVATPLPVTAPLMRTLVATAPRTPFRLGAAASTRTADVA